MARKNKAAIAATLPHNDGNNSDAGPEQQLFEELAAASAQRTHPQPKSSAVRGAALLNHARLPTGTAADQRNLSDGKLRLPTLKREDHAKLHRKNLASSGDVYEVPAGSPEKDTQESPFKLPTIRSTRPLKRVNKGRQTVRTVKKQVAAPKQPEASGDNSPDDMAPAQLLNMGAKTWSDQIHPLAEPSSPPPTLPTLETSVRESTLPLRNLKRHIPNQASRPERSSKSPRRKTGDAPARSRKSHPMVVIPPSKSKDSISSSAPPEPEQPLMGSRARHTDGPSNKSTKHVGSKQVPSKNAIPDATSIEGHATRRGRKPPRSRQPTSADGENEAQSSVDTTVQKTSNRGYEKTTENASSRQIHSPRDEPQSPARGDEHGLGGSKDNPEGSNEAFEFEDSDEDLDSISQVFKFLNSKRRPGDCVTDEAIDIARSCQKSLDAHTSSDMTLEDLTRSTGQLRAKLMACGATKDPAKCKAIKIDAYAHLFRYLTRYLEMAYNWLEETYGSVEDSLSSMRIITHTMDAMVAFKDSIASWKIHLRSHGKGDRLVKDVDSELIAPLRRAQKEYRTLLDELEARARRERIRERIRQKYIEEEQEMIQKEKEAAIYQQKWSHWQDLHTWRLKCEVEKRLRKRLFVDQSLFNTLLKQSEERDANGQKFERLPVFKERDSPPARREPPAVDISWPEEDVAALVDGLQIHCGPNVFQDIFRAYCFPRGELRRYTVPEITTQAALIRSELSERFRENDWEIPAWVKQIPILP